MGWSRHIERSPVGQVLLTALMALLVGVLLIWNMPWGEGKRALIPVAGAVVQAAGLEQDWGLFAPNPRDASVGVYATVHYVDGRTARWYPPEGGFLVSPYRDYRWQKLVERLRSDDYQRMWRPFAEWVAREHGPGVRRVVLTRTFRPVVRPGDPGPRPAVDTYDFHHQLVRP